MAVSLSSWKMEPSLITPKPPSWMDGVLEHSKKRRGNIKQNDVPFVSIHWICISRFSSFISFYKGLFTLIFPITDTE